MKIFGWDVIFFLCESQAVFISKREREMIMLIIMREGEDGTKIMTMRAVL